MREIKFRAWDGDASKGYKESGYQMRQAKYHPFANKRGYVPEHRLIIENHLGRYLKPRIELVHHLDGNRSNNKIENLKLSNPKDHAKGHIGERNKNGNFACMSPEFNQKKFRLYDKDRNILQIYTLNELISKTFRRGKFEYRGELTGLKDKNGKEIYEGDAVLVEDTYTETVDVGVGSVPVSQQVDNHIGLVCFDNGSFKIRIFDNADVIKKGLYTFEEIEDEVGLESIEVIGNIYESPELLEAV